MSLLSWRRGAQIVAGAALAAGLPDCAGVALGMDRLVMIATGASDIDAVLAFPVERA